MTRDDRRRLAGVPIRLEFAVRDHESDDLHAVGRGQRRPASPGAEEHDSRVPRRRAGGASPSGPKTRADEQVERVATGERERAGREPRDDVARTDANGIDHEHEHERDDEGDRPGREDLPHAVPHVPSAVEALEGGHRDEHRAGEGDVPPREARPQDDPSHSRSRRHEEDGHHEAAAIHRDQREDADGATQAVGAREAAPPTATAAAHARPCLLRLFESAWPLLSAPSAGATY